MKTDPVASHIGGCAKFRWMLLLGFMLICVLAHAAPERKLAGVKLGMKPKQVFDLLGDPTALIIAQPPLTMMESSDLTLPGTEGSGDSGAAPPPGQPNSLIFLYNGDEIELTASVQNEAANTVAEVLAGEQPAATKAEVKLPLWAYNVRAAKLALDQQELIYKVNDTYSLGITITGQGIDAEVTDIIACSFEPFKKWPAEPSKEWDRRDINFLFKYGPTKIPLPAGTSKGVLIGSRLDEVLKAHKWPDYFLAFTTEKVATLTIDPERPMVDPGIPLAPVVTTAAGDSSNLASSASGVASGTECSFLQARGSALGVNFTTNCTMLYPDDNVALTLINFTVVRIQIGKELVHPTPPSTTPGVGTGAY